MMSRRSVSASCLIRTLVLVAFVAVAGSCAPSNVAKQPTTETQPPPLAAAATPTVTAAPTPVVTPATAPARNNIVAKDPVVRRILELNREGSQANQYLEQMIAKFGPRLTSSHNLMGAQEWARDEFAKLGLNARLEKWGEFPIGFDRGPSSGFMLTPKKIKLDFTTPSWTPGVFGPVTGPAILYPTTARAARKLNKKLDGAWIVHGGTPTKVRDKDRKRIDAILAKSAIAGHIYRARDPRGKLVHTFGRYSIAWSTLPQKPQIYLRGDHHLEIVTQIKAGQKVSLQFSIDNTFFRGPVPLYNVIADIPGTEFPEQYVIIGGHIDSWDGAVGAVDNGTGVATSLEAARLIMATGAKPRRTIRFMLWSGEEQGLLGSGAYVSKHRDEMKNVSVALVHDGGTNYLSGLSVTPEMAADMKKVFEAVFTLDAEMPFALYYAEGMVPGGSDHNSFIGENVPGFFWQQSGKANYLHAHHTQYDTLDAVVPEYQRHSSAIVAVGAWGIAQLDGLLDRTDSAPVTQRPPSGVQVDGTTLTVVEKDSKLHKQGFRSGDTIVAVNGDKVNDIMTLVRKVFTAQGPTVEFGIKRGKKTIKLVIENQNAALRKIRAERMKRRTEKYGKLDFKKPFAGKAIEKPSLLERFLGGGKNKGDAKKPGSQ